MKNKCVRCGNDATSWSSVCYECKDKEERLFFYALLGVIAAVIAIIISIRFAWAEYAFDDWRCAFSECRIIKQ